MKKMGRLQSWRGRRKARKDMGWLVAVSVSGKKKK